MLSFSVLTLFLYISGDCANLTYLCVLQRDLKEVKKRVKATRLAVLVGYEVFNRGPTSGLRLVRTWRRSRQHRAILQRKQFTHAAEHCSGGRVKQKIVTFCAVLLARFDKVEKTKAVVSKNATVLDPVIM